MQKSVTIYENAHELVRATNNFIDHEMHRQVSYYLSTYCCRITLSAVYKGRRQTQFKDKTNLPLSWFLRISYNF